MTDFSKHQASSLEENSLTERPSTTPLSGVLMSMDKMEMSEKKFRRYAGSMRTTTMMKGVNDTSTKSVIYEVGQAVKKKVDYLKRVVGEEFVDQMNVNVSGVISEELTSLHKKHSVFSGLFRTMDFSSVLMQLTRGVAFYAEHGTLTCNDLRGGAVAQIVAFNTTSDPISASAGSVFIPKQASMDLYPGAFYALAACANFSGSVVYTDIVAVDGNNSPIMNEPSGSSLAMACVGGARIIMSMYEASNAGGVAAYSITVGAHKSVTVVGHTDEGGYMRDVLRRRNFGPSRGGIYCQLAETYIGLPVPSISSNASFSNYVDQIALMTAGAVALCDPLVKMEGKYYPTTVTTEREALGEDATPEMKKAASNKVIKSNASSIAITADQFSSTYVSELCKIFSVKEGEPMRAAVLSINARMGDMVKSGSRHLDYEVVCPFFWIEPTSLFNYRPNTLAQQEGYGCLGIVDEQSQLSSFRGRSAHVHSAAGSCTMFSVNWASARQSMLFVHLNGHSQNGLSRFVPAQLFYDNVCNKGGTSSTAEAVTAKESVDKWLWVRGQSKIIAPAEMLYVGSRIGFYMGDSEIDPMTGEVTEQHVPFAEELNGTVMTWAFRPRGLGSNDSNHEERKYKRTRSQATQALHNARLRGTQLSNDVGSKFMFGNFEPMVTLPVKAADIDDDETKQHETKGSKDEQTMGIGETNPAVILQTPGRLQTNGGRNKPVVSSTLGSNLNAPTGRDRGKQREEDVSDRVQDEETPIDEPAKVRFDIAPPGTN